MRAQQNCMRHASIRVEPLRTRNAESGGRCCLASLSTSQKASAPGSGGDAVVDGFNKLPILILDVLHLVIYVLHAADSALVHT